MIFINKRRAATEIFPESVRKLWNDCELRVLVLLSLFLQIVLILLGNRRKYIARNWIRVIVWLAYLSADWIAALSLGVLSNSQGDQGENGSAPAPPNTVWAFWAPFLLLHLGYARLHRISTEILPSEVKGDRSKSVLFDACRLAKSLQSLEAEGKQKWELISGVWVEMLCYAANKCEWSYHAERLRVGGELITHVWLLMAHLGITCHFQVSQAPAELQTITSIAI